jgi:hypothetical protein
MKKVIYILIIVFALPFVSCNEEFLERAPLDEISSIEFWKTANDLELYTNSFYNSLPSWARVGTGHGPMPDNNSDIGVYQDPNSRLMGNSTVPTTAKSKGSVWWWSNIRKANFFLANVDKAEGDEASINQFKGEGYFFRAYFYFSQLTKYGDLPIYDTYFDATGTEELYAGIDSRAEVANFILDDLDSAITLLKKKSDLSTPRISMEVAQLFKARVALYEGTWEKYHAGTDFGVAGSDGTSFLQEAADAAKAIIDGGAFSLHGDYQSLFNQTNLKSNSEVLLWRQYDFLSFGNTYGNDMNTGGANRSAITRFMVRSYLCTDGDPISVSPLYQGDLTLADVVVDRDPRLDASMMKVGDPLVIAKDGTVTLFEAPNLNNVSNNMCVTGYEYQKFKNPNIDPATGAQSKNIAKIIMRYAEVLLIYAEAQAELGSITQGDLDISINLLRDRVSMPHITLGAITTDSDWPDYGHALTDVIYEIRRERAVEMLAEGLRFNDLMRWRAHKLIVGKRPAGAFYSAVMASTGSAPVDGDGYIDPFVSEISAGYAFDPERDYLSAIPSDELVLNENLTQNPGW